MTSIVCQRSKERLILKKKENVLSQQPFMCDSQWEVEILQSQLHACQKLEVVLAVPHPRSSFRVTIALFITAYVDSGVQTEAEPRANNSCLKDMEGVSVPVPSRVCSPMVVTQKKTASTQQMVIMQSAGSHSYWLFS